jgi:hypothetical protein
MTRPTCARCHRALRPSKTTLTQHPGTVAHYARGHCAGCYRRLMRGQSGPINQPGNRDRVYDVDEVVIELATTGSRVHLNPAERRTAVQQLTARGYGADLVALMVGCTPRHVTRLRTKAPLAA